MPNYHLLEQDDAHNCPGIALYDWYYPAEDVLQVMGAVGEPSWDGRYDTPLWQCWQLQDGTRGTSNIVRKCDACWIPYQQQKNELLCILRELSKLKQKRACGNHAYFMSSDDEMDEWDSSDTEEHSPAVAAYGRQMAMDYMSLIDDDTIPQAQPTQQQAAQQAI
jgi:hypothetical protein